MAWPLSSAQSNDDIRDAWGHKFRWTPNHQSPEEYRPLKYSYDVLGEECLDILNELSPPPQKASENDHKPLWPSAKQEASSETPTAPKRDLFVLLKENRSKHPKLQQLWDETTKLPSWVDWDQIARGQEVFYRYGGATLTGLAFQSLVGGMGSAKVVETLTKTGGFGIKVARHRLFETTQHILECTKSLESIQGPDGAGFASSLRVRLLHAAVRQRILKLTKSYPAYYSVEANGVPINDIDCVATIATFSSSIIFLSLPRQGIFLRQQEIEDYLALWRLIALYTGTPTSFFATPAKAKAITESLLLHEVDPSSTSRILANNVLRALEGAPPGYASFDFLCVQTRWLNGPKLSDSLGIPVPPFHYYILMGGQCLFFMALCYSHRAVPYLDRRKIATLRRVFWHVIVESKEMGMGGITEFAFKYVPQKDKITEKGEAWEKHDYKSWEGIESRSVRTLAVAGACLALGTWASWRIIGWTVRSVW